MPDARGLTRTLAVHQQFDRVIERTGGDHFTGVDEENFVGVFYGIEAMSDDNFGSFFG